MRKTQDETGKRLLRSGKAVLLGAGAALLLCLLVLLIASVGVSQGLLPADAKYQITVVCCVVSAFCGALIALRESAAKGLLVGICVGAAFFLLLLSLGAIVYGTVSFENGGLGLLGAAVCGGAAAGILGGGGEKKTKHRRKR